MRIALTTLLTVVAGVVLCVGSRAVAQVAGQQNPVGPYTQSMPNTPPNEYGAANDAQPIYEDGMNEPVYGDAQGTMAEGMAMMDNALWDGAMAGPCCANCGGGNACPPNWYTKQGVRILTRSRPRDAVIGYDYTFGSLETILTTRSAAPDVSNFYSMTLGHYFMRDRKNRDHFVELSFWGLNEWKDKAERRSNGGLISEYAVKGYSLPGFDEADLQSVYYASYNNNFELNGRFTPRGQPTGWCCFQRQVAAPMPAGDVHVLSIRTAFLPRKRDFPFPQ